MSEKELAIIGKFVIAFILFIITTAIFGAIASIDDSNPSVWLAAWISGAFLYALTVALMW